MSMTLKFEKFRNPSIVEALIIGALLVLMAVLGYWQVMVRIEKEKLEQAAAEILSVLKSTQKKAQGAVKINGRAPSAYGVFFEDKRAIVFADWNNNKRFDYDEQVELFSLNADFDYIFNEPLILFKSLEKINGVCFAEDCNVTGGESLIIEIKREQENKRFYIKKASGEILVK